MSILETCKRHQINTRDYLLDVLPGLEDRPHKELPNLTPLAWKARQEALPPRGLPLPLGQPCLVLDFGGFRSSSGINMNPRFTSVSWRWVFLYCAVALGLAIPFNLGWLVTWFDTHFPGSILSRWPFLPAAIGPAIGALIAGRFDGRTVQTTTLLGASTSRTLVTALIPLGCFSLVGPEAGLYALVAMVYALGEEFGWRGYLADALAPLRGPWPLVITSGVWWFWHLRFSSNFDLLVFPLIILVSSLLLGHAARTSGSVLVAAAMHALIINLTSSGAPAKPMILAGVATLLAWILMGSVWPLPQPTDIESESIKRIP